MSASDNLLQDLTPYIYGTTRLGDEQLSNEHRIFIALEAMNSGVWFHASEQYGNTLEILGEAFRRQPQAIPKIIFKVEGENIDELRAVIQRNLQPLDLSHMDIAQLCLRGPIEREYRQGGACFDEFRKWKEKGLVHRFIKEVFPWSSTATLDALLAGHADDVVDGYIFYFNPLQRFALNPLWQEITERKLPIIAMRTVCGNTVHALRDVPGAAWKPYLQQRAKKVAPIFESSEIQDWVEFCLRFVFSHPQVIASVGATADTGHFHTLFELSKQRLRPLSAGTLNTLTELQYAWSNDVDIHAPPWSM